MEHDDALVQRAALFLKTINTVQGEDISCDDCFEHVDKYAEMLREGQTPSRVMQQVEAHLAQCPCCTTEFKALMSIISADEEPQNE